jgi:chromosome segregation ATPase
LIAVNTTSASPSLSAIKVLGWQNQLLASCGPQHGAIHNRVLLGFSALKEDALMKNFLSRNVQQADCGGKERCDATFAEAQRDLGCRFALLYLHTLLLARPEETGLCRNLSLGMLDQSQQLASIVFPCITRKRMRHNLQPVEEQCTPKKSENGQDWRDLLSAQIQIEAKCRENSLLRLVGDICDDLEQRCLKAEEPFRQEQENVQELRQQLDELREQKSRLQGQLIERDMILDSLETNRTETEDTLNAVQLENAQLLARVDDSERKIQTATRAAQDEINTLKKEGDRKEFDLRAALAAKASIVEDQDMKLKGSEERIKTMHSDTELARSCSAGLQEQIQSLEAELRHCRHDLQAEQTAKTNVDIRMQRIGDQNDILTKEIGEIKQSHQGAVSLFEEQRHGFEKQHESLKGELESLVSNHAVALQRMSTKLTEQDASYAAKLTNTLARLDNAKNEVVTLQKENKDNQTTIFHQRQEIKLLEDIVAERDEEISEFQTMRQTLAAAIGTKVPDQKPVDRKHARKGVHHTNAREPSQHSPASHRRSRQLIAEQKEVYPFEDVDNMIEHGNRSFESTSSKSGPTPKRARPRKAFKVPTIHQPQLSIAANRSVKLQDRRLPLRDLSAGRANLSPVQPVRSTKTGYENQDHGEDSDARELEEAVDLEFGSLVMLTSTPFTPNPVASKVEAGFYDDTTVDDTTVDQ